jgi:hypothetical protein
MKSLQNFRIFRINKSEIYEHALQWLIVNELARTLFILNGQMVNVFGGILSLPQPLSIREGGGGVFVISTER